MSVLAWRRRGRSLCSSREWNALVRDGVGFRVKGLRWRVDFLGFGGGGGSME